MLLEETKYVILVDENDHETGMMEKMEAHQKALLHRAISVFICNTKGEWLLQRRALNKYHSGGLWTNACCSHPQPGETYSKAASRRLKEEMGLEILLTEIFSFIYKADMENGITEHELDRVFLGITDMAPVINTDEVHEWKYLSFKELCSDVKANPEKYTVWFRQIYEQVNKYILTR